MPNAQLGPNLDLAQRLAKLEAQVKSLSAPGTLPPTTLPATYDYTQAVGGVTVAPADGHKLMFWATFPYTQPYLSLSVGQQVAANTTVTVYVYTGQYTPQGMVVQNSTSWTLAGGSGGIGLPHYLGYPYSIDQDPAMSLGGTPSDYGNAWAISIQAAITTGTGSATLWLPCLTARSTL